MHIIPVRSVNKLAGGGAGTACCTIYSIKILRVFSNHREKQPALRFLKVQAAFDRERSSENYFSDDF